MAEVSVETPIETTTDQARAAVTGHNVRYVLLGSTLGAVVLYGALLLFYFH
jgi:hypothetical protein